MEHLLTDLPYVYILVSLAIGIIIGVALSKILNKGPKVSDLQEQLEQANDQLESYQQHVGTHFQKTAELVNNLTESYRSVHEHLSEGAQNLAQTQGNALENTAFTALTDSSAVNAKANIPDSDESNSQANNAQDSLTESNIPEPNSDTDSESSPEQNDQEEVDESVFDIGEDEDILELEDENDTEKAAKA